MSYLNPFNWFGGGTAAKQERDLERAEYNEYGTAGRPRAATTPLATDTNDYAYRNRATMIRGYSQPQPVFETVHEDRPVIEKTQRYHYHGPFRHRFSDNYPKVKLNLIVTMVILLIVVIIGAVFWGIQAGETCPPLTPHGYCPPNQLMLDIGVGMASLGAILFCLQAGLYTVIYVFHWMD